MSVSCQLPIDLNCFAPLAMTALSNFRPLPTVNGPLIQIRLTQQGAIKFRPVRFQ